MCVCISGLWLVTCCVCVCVCVCVWVGGYVSALLCSLPSAGPGPQLSLFPHLKPCAPSQCWEPPGSRLSAW